jgi:outer membrane immunogenic protein
MSLRRIVACAIASLSLIGAALLAPSTAQAQVFGTGPWTGLYLGAHGGYGWTNDSNPDTSGWVGGVQAGYNLQLGSAVVGVEADYTWGSVEGSGSFAGLPVSGSIDAMWSIRARLGWVVANSVMLYATAGYGGFDSSLRTVVNGLNLNSTADFSALVLGGGAEVLVTRNIMLRGEALHFSGDGNGTAAGATGDVTVIRAGLSYKF